MPSYPCKRIISYLLLLFPLLCFAQIIDQDMTTPTVVIGTPEQPTIEGGVINTPHNKKENVVSNSSDISDEFSQDENIKSLLHIAAKEGKLAYVLQRAEQLHLPATVALVPMVESHYQNDAVSPKGATGAWQLMPETAKAYGLNTEDRKNFTTSTDVALHVLGDLHQQWGNWTFAFAAYNAGSTHLLSALQQHPKVQGIDDLDLPLETKQYISRLKKLYYVMTRLSIQHTKHNSTE